ncbi:hypothetical protein GBA52_019458 [Prunus armeniaca]|nr:hypothetical protein GBA52_006782 [Prunus armeniaca]KAH0995594.1 hypothetical protein GBA52_019458 [Prunus armeniaca]
MVSTDNGNHKEEIEESNGSEVKAQIPFDVSISQKTLLSNVKSPKRFPDAVPNRIRFLKFGSASARFKRLAEERDEISRSVVSIGHGFKESTGFFPGKLIGFHS